MNLRPAPQDLAAWLPDALEVMERNDWRLQHERRLKFTEAPDRMCKPWTGPADKDLVALVGKNVPRDLIAARLQRTRRAINARLCILRKAGAL